MKEITKSWLQKALIDLEVMQQIKSLEHLSPATAFHAQQCVEKCFKALLEEQGAPTPRTHNLRELHRLTRSRLPLTPEQFDTLIALNELYIESRYPGEPSLLPSGQPSAKETETFYAFAHFIYDAVSTASGES